MWRLLVTAIALACVGCGIGGPRGPASVIDGDSLIVGGMEVRLYGIDAPELTQRCGHQGGSSHDCGRLSADYLERLIKGRSVACQSKGYTRTGIRIAVCTVAGHDLGRAMVAAGYAASFSQMTDAYTAEDQHARSKSAGLWAEGYLTPAEWRQAENHGGAKWADVFDDHVFFERARNISLEAYEKSIYIAYLWAGVAIVVVGLLAFLATWFQVRLSRLQTRASLLFDIDKRWEGSDLEGPRRTIVEVMKTASHKVAQQPLDTRREAYNQAYADEMTKLSRQDENKYFAALRVYGFFETVGYAARKGYLDPNDITSLFGPSLRETAPPFRHHIDEMRTQFADDSLYEHTLWLFDRLE
jgi:endonuclease YncB( thermonuclease family)